MAFSIKDSQYNIQNITKTQDMQKLWQKVWYDLVKALQKIIETAHVCSIANYEFGESLLCNFITHIVISSDENWKTYLSCIRPHKTREVAAWLFSFLLGMSESAKGQESNNRLSSIYTTLQRTIKRWCNQIITRNNDFAERTLPTL